MLKFRSKLIDTLSFEIVKKIPRCFSNAELSALNLEIGYVGIFLVLVEYIEFKNIDLSILTCKHIIDTRGIWS